MTPLAVVEILARAGGGSGGFSSGGGFSGGGGGFSSGGGSYGGGYGAGGAGIAISGGGLLVFVIVIIAFAMLVLLASWRARWVYARERGTRASAVRLAALEAATDDSDFDPDTVQREATKLWLAVQNAWRDGDRDRLAELIGPDLLVEWIRRLDDFDRRGWRNIVEPHGNPTIEYLGLVNREGEEDDRVVVRLTATIDDYVLDRHGAIIHHDGESSSVVTVAEWWTLHPPGDRWRVMSIEQDREGRHHLQSELVAVPWGDSRVGDEALLETTAGAGNTVVGTGVAVAEIAPAELDEDARAAALDLALADGRFSPDVLAISVRRAAEAWVEAIDGSDSQLERVAAPAAVDELLYQGDASRQTRLVVRGGRVAELRIVAVDPHAQPATMTVHVTIVGRIYTEDRDTTTVLSGDPNRDARAALTWTFALDETATAGELPWRLAAVAR